MTKSVAERQARSHNWRDHDTAHDGSIYEIANRDDARQKLAHYLEMTEGVGRLMP